MITEAVRGEINDQNDREMPPSIEPDNDVALVPFARPPVLPSVDEFTFIFQMAEALCRSQMVPNSTAGKPADVAIVLLAARDMGIPLTQAFAKLNVINGKLSLSAEVIVALIIRDGHRIWCDEWEDDHVTVAAQRRGSDYVARYTYTLADAVQAGLCTLDADGHAHARDDKNSPKPWEKFTKNMMWARAASGIARMQFPDCTAGISYTPDELSDEERFVSHPATQAPADVIEGFRLRIAALPEDRRESLVLAWKTWGIEPLSRLTNEAVESVETMIAKAEAIDVASETTSEPREDVSTPPTADEAGTTQEASSGDPVAVDDVRSEPGDEEAPVDRLAGPQVFNGDSGHCSDCGSAIWFSIDAEADGGAFGAWLHADDDDVPFCPGSGLVVPAGDGIDVDALYAATHDPAVLEARITAEVGALTQTKLVKAILDAGLPATGGPTALKAALVAHRLAAHAS